jgi:DNA-binding transcriptional MerR regulator
MTRSNTAVSIGIAASKAGCSASAIRNWERQGALPFTIERDAFGRRCFDQSAVAALVEFVAARRKRLEEAWAGNGS